MTNETYQSLLERACALSHLSQPDEISVILAGVEILDPISRYRVMEQIMKNAGIPIKEQREAISEFLREKKFNDKSETLSDAIILCIKEYGNEGIARRKLFRSCGRKDSALLERVIENLIAERIIEARSFKNLRGKPTVKYYAV